MDWDNLAPFIFFVIWIAASFLKASKKKQNRRPPADEPIITSGENTAEPVPSQPKRPLDYMMKKPQTMRETTVDSIDAGKSEVPKEIAEAKTAVYQVMQQMKAYQEQLARQHPVESEQQPDIIRRGEISSANTAMRISIEKQQIMQAITYAQVLEQPKSLHYLKRFGIKRVLHKD